MQHYAAFYLGPHCLQKYLFSGFSEYKGSMIQNYTICLIMFSFRYPEARRIERKIVYHAGPTNSGKTYHALQRFMMAKSGIYCGPLRMLAVEVFNKCNEAVSSSYYLLQRISTEPVCRSRKVV